MRITPYFKWNARKAGGIFVGLRYSFPCSIYEPAEDGKTAVTFTQARLTIGFGPCTVTFIFDYNFRYAE